MVSVLAFYCNNQSSNPSEIHSIFCKMLLKENDNYGRGGGQIVSVLAFYSYDTSLNLGDTYIFYPIELFEK